MTTQEHLATRDAPSVPSRLFRWRPLPDLALTAILVVGVIAGCQALVVFGIVSRFAHQKGFNLLREALKQNVA